MKPRHVVLTLPVRSCDRSRRFYESGLSLPVQQLSDDLLAVEIPGISLFLAQDVMFAGFSQRAGAAPAPASDTASLLLSCAIATKEEVDQTLDAAERAGGAGFPTLTRSHFGHEQYVGYFRDPDGHIWELVTNLPKP